VFQSTHPRGVRRPRYNSLRPKDANTHLREPRPRPSENEDSLRRGSIQAVLPI